VSCAFRTTKDVVTRLRVDRRLLQRETVKPDDFFPGQLVSGTPQHEPRVNNHSVIIAIERRVWSAPVSILRASIDTKLRIGIQIEL
jgi:hypothetical protein